MVKPGQKLQILRAYQTRAFAMREHEALGGEYTEFDRTGREPRLVQLSAGDTLVAVTASNPDGYVYARRLDNASVVACVLLPDSYT